MKETKQQRAAGVLLPLTALPSAYGIGSMGRQATTFVDLLAEAGQRFWQLLPIGPTGYGDSPYQSFSSFAGSPYLIDLEALIEEGLLARGECEAAFTQTPPDRVDYAQQYRVRLPLLRRAYHAFCRMAGAKERSVFAAFCERQAGWLDDYALFMAIKDANGGQACVHWARPLLQREQSALADTRKAIAEDIDFYRFLQVVFFNQWDRLHDYARRRSVSLIGDLPIYVSSDSVDVWAHPELFCLDDMLCPLAVAGCPPDGFSAAGQLWGNPLYCWERHAATNYAWWVERLRRCFALFDTLRIDHFRGFESYYAIPQGATDARTGEWRRGPGAALFRVVLQQLGECEIIAEDLGYMTDGVRALLRECGFPGMRVLQFGFDRRDDGSKNDHLPHNYPTNCVAYTGTHDNQTLCGWLASISQEELRALREYLGDFDTPLSRLPQRLISLLMQSRAQLCIVPLQDYLLLGDEARINTPATLRNNWCWRVRREMLTEQLAEEMRAITVGSGR